MAIGVVAVRGVVEAVFLRGVGYLGVVDSLAIGEGEPLLVVVLS